MFRTMGKGVVGEAHVTAIRVSGQVTGDLVKPHQADRVKHDFPLPIDLLLSLCSVANVLHHHVAALLGYLVLNLPRDDSELLCDLVTMLVGLDDVLVVPVKGTLSVLRAGQGDGVGLLQPLPREPAGGAGVRVEDVVGEGDQLVGSRGGHTVS
jgi:hypothetical protein